MKIKTTSTVFFSAVLVCCAFAYPVSSMIVARGQSFIEEDDGSLIPHAYKQRSALVVVTNKNALVGINSMVQCPASGNIWIEVDYVANVASSLYNCIGGLVPTSGNSFSFRTYGTTARMYLGQYNGQYFKATLSFNTRQVPFSCGFGIINDMDVFAVNDIRYEKEMYGGERGDGQFIYFGRSGSTWDDVIGTVIGIARIYVHDELVFQGIPCTRNSDGLAGYYDIVNKRFCPNLGGIEAIDIEDGE